MASTETTIKCTGCGQDCKALIFPSINAAESPELKEQVMSGELFMYECPHCEHKQLLKYNMLYHDPDERLILCLSDVHFLSDGMEGYTCRMVSDIGALIEKVKIFDAGLDDVAVEMCKYVTAREFGKEVDFKFLKLDGGDNEITFTYPSNGQMEMVQVGLNVYEDCQGIISRNPVLKEDSKGLARIDKDWIARYIG